MRDRCRVLSLMLVAVASGCGGDSPPQRRASEAPTSEVTDLAGTLPEAVWPPAFWFDRDRDPPTTAVSDQVMVSTANPWATNAALEILRSGGNAIDAAAAAQFVLNVVEPQSSGIGGGCFILFLPKGAEAPVVIDGRETAPRGVTSELFLDRDGAEIPFYPERVSGGRSVGVPGTLAACDLALRRFGTRSLPEVLAAASRLAREGFPVSRRLASAIREEEARLRLFEASRRLFFREDGSPLQEGEIFRQPDLARTFQLLAEGGLAVFYEGEIARDIVRCVRQATHLPGFLELEDLRAYRPLVRDPVRGRYRGYDVFGVGPPSSGGATVIETLQILGGFDLSRYPPGSPDALHLLLEAEKLAFADRDRTIADPDFVRVPVSTLCSPAFAAARRKRLDVDRASEWPGSAAEEIDSQETSHLTVVDAEGNVLAMTTTIEQVFGSCLVVPGRGFLLNNELTDFAGSPIDSAGCLVANRVEPGKRPRSSMAPTILMRDGRPFLALGSPGGARIIGIVLNVVVNVVDWGMELQDAINFPRIYNRGLAWSEPELLYFDDAMLALRGGVPGALARLTQMGHAFADPPVGYRAVGGVHAILVGPNGRLYGGADPRREGVALGY